MKTVILAGGRGTRISEYTHSIPKPMVEIGEKPMLWHIMNCYARYGFNDFCLALGYKGHLIKEYFLNHHQLNSDLTVNLATGAIKNHPPAIENKIPDWKVTLVDTGLNTLTGGRVKRLAQYIGKETFLLTYGDGVANINIEELLKFHKAHGKMVTITTVHPVARFGEVEFDKFGHVTSFKEKPQTNSGWINGGFFVIEPKFLDLIEDDTTILEREPLEKAAQMGQLMAYQHQGFWHCMDTVRDRDVLEELWQSGQAPWTTNLQVGKKAA